MSAARDGLRPGDYCKAPHPRGGLPYTGYVGKIVPSTSPYGCSERGLFLTRDAALKSHPGDAWHYVPAGQLTKAEEPIK